MPPIMEEDEAERKASNISSNGNNKENRKSKSDESASFLRASRGGNSEKVLEYLKNGTDINTCNANGLNALHLSSKEGHVHIVQELLARGAKIDAATKKGNTALHIASLAGQEEVVKILVSHSASVNVQSQNGFTPLYMAAQENHDGVVRFLLASGASQSLATEDGFTPLAVALQQGHDKVVAVLLENDTRGKVRLPALHIAAKKDDTKAAALLLQNDHNPDVTSKSGFTPLHISSHYGNEKIATVLLQRGADVNYSAKHNITPLHVAAKWGKSNMVALLLEHGANLEARTRDGLTPLHCAARSGHENVVDMMLGRGAPISAKTKNGLAPLHMSSQGDHVDAARILLHHKAPVDEVTVDYLTALHVAAHCGHVRVAKLLLDRKADPNSRALNGFTPLHIACKKNRIKVVELLLKYGASIEATTESGLTPLHVASFMGCMNIVIFLIQHQASPDEATVRGETPLHLAARANQTDIIRILLRNGAKVDATAREQQTPLHIAARLGNVDIVVLLLQSGAKVDAVTKDLYTALHIAAKEGQEEVAAILLEHNAKLDSTTKKGFTPLHLAAKYGNIKVAKLLLSKETAVDAEGKNGVTPLHVAVHYDNTPLAALLLDRGASPHAAAKNGYTPLHISAKKNQLDIARTLVEYGAKVNSESKAGFTPLHLAAQEGHSDMADLLIRSNGSVNAAAKNGLTPLHLCAQEDRVEVAKILIDSGCNCDLETKAGYTPLHVAAHFGQVNMVRLLLNQGVRVDVNNELGYTPLHQAAQQGHSQIVNLLLEAGAQPNNVANNGQTALSIAQKLGYISVVETLKVVTDEVVTTTTTTVIEEKYRVLAPESMQETFMSDSEDEGGDENPGDQSYKYLTTEEMKGLGDDSINIDVTNDEKEKKESMNRAAEASIEKKILEMERNREYGANTINNQVQPDNIEIPSKPPVHAGRLTWKSFLVSFMVDARGGAMRGCRHSGVRVIIPPRKAPMPMRVTCRYLKKDKLIHPPPLNEGEALASRVLELGPAKANFLGPVIIEVPHFASLRGKEREIIIMRSDDGEKWREHSLEATEEAVQEVLQESFDGEDSNQLEDMNTNRITRILTTDFPMYFAVISRIRQELHYIGPEGGLVNSSVVPQVQAMFPQGALTKKIKVGLQAQPIPAELTAKLLGNRVAVSPIVTVEPRRRKFHKPITLTIPVPVAAGKGMINQYSGDTPTLRLLCSITGGTTRAQWEDVTGSTPLTFLNDTVSFTTTVSARFWLMDCRNVPEATKMATSLYKEAIHVPFMAKFLVFSKRHEQLEARLRVFCMTDDREDKTLEHQEHFHEVAKSRDVEVLEGKVHYLEFSGNLHPVTKSGDQLTNKFLAFRENRLPLTVRVKDPHNDPIARISFFKEGRAGKGEASPTPICNLNLALPREISPDHTYNDEDIMAIQAKYSFLREAGYGKFNTIQKADLRISDISNLLGKDWIKVGRELGIEEQDINLIMTEYPDNDGQQAMVMLRLWLNTHGSQATGNALKDALAAAGRQDIIDQCTRQLEEVTNHDEMILAESQLQENGFSSFKEGLNGHSSKSSSLKRDYSMDVSYDQQEMIQEHEHMEQITESAEDEETKYLAEEKVFKEATTTFSQSAAQARESSQIREVKESFSSQEQHVIQESKVQEIMGQMNLEEASEYKIESRKESTFNETKVEESKMSATAADGTTTTQESLVQESLVEEILMEEVDGSRTTVSAVEAFKGVLETKDGEVVTSDFETFAHSQQNVTDTETLLAKAGDSVDVGQKEEEVKKGGVEAAGASSIPSLPSSLPPNISPSNTTTIGYVKIESSINKGVEISLDPKERFSHSDSVRSFHSQEDSSREGFTELGDSKKKEDRMDKKIKRLAHEIAGTPDSPLTESGLFSDTGFSSADHTRDYLKSKKLPLDLNDPTTDTDMEYSELSPSPLGHELFSNDLPRPSSLLNEGVPLTGERDVFLVDTPGKEANAERQVVEIDVERIAFRGDVDEAVKGTLKLSLVKGRDLQKKDIFSKSDPYAVLSFLDKKEKTKTIRNNHNPEWNHSFDISIDDGNGFDVIVEVFNRKKIGRDDSLGHAVFNTKMLYDPPGMIEKWITLQDCKSGQVLLTAEFISDKPSKVSSADKKEAVEIKFAESSTTEKVKSYHYQQTSTSITLPQGNLNEAATPEKMEYVPSPGEEELNKTLSEIFDSNTEVVSFEVEKDICNLESKGEKVSIITKSIEKKITEEAIQSGGIPSQAFVNIPNYMKLRIHKATNLEKQGLIGKADPYVVVSYGAETFKSRTISNNQNPVWEYDVTLKIDGENSSPVSFEIFDEDIGKDDSLGKTTLHLQEILNVDNKCIPLKDCKSGEIYISSCSYDTIVAPDNESAEKIKEKKNNKEKIKLVIHKASKLGKKGMFGKADPYVVVQHGDKKYKSQTIKNNLNPSWEFAVDLELSNDDSTPVYVKVYDKDINKDDEMGDLKLDIDYLLHSGDITNKSMKLENSKSGKLTFSTFVKEKLEEPAAEEPIVTKPAEVVIPAAVETEEPEKLQLIVHRGSELAKTDIIGKSDPYVVVQYQDKKFKSKTVKSSQNPVWDFVVDLPVYPKKADKVSISVFDSDIGKDDSMGTTVLGVPELLESGNVENRCIKLDKCKSGLLYVSYARGRVVLTPAPAKTESPDLPLEKKTIVEEVTKEPTVEPTKVVETHSSNFMRSAEKVTVQESIVTKSSKSVKFENKEFTLPIPLMVNVHRGYGLRKTDFIGCSDPYVVLKNGSQTYKSKVIKNNQNPVWDFEVLTDIDNIDTDIKIDIYDEDVGNDDHMGSITLSPLSLITSGTFSKKCFKLQNGKGGDIFVSTSFLNQRESPVSETKSILQSSSKQEVSGSPLFGCGTINVHILEGKNLEKKDLIGKSDPFIILSMNDTFHRSPSVKNDQNPKFNYECLFEIKEGSLDKIKVEVLDQDFGNMQPLIGELEIDTVSVMRKPMKAQWLPLNNSGHLLVSAEYQAGSKQQPEEVAQHQQVITESSSGLSSDKLEGTIALHVLRGKKLEKKDIIGKSDPFLLINFGEESFKSKTVDNSQDPHFDYKCHFDVTSKSPKTIQIEVYDEDYGSKNDFMGEVILSVEDIKSKSILLSWVPLDKCTSGELQLSAQYKNVTSKPSVVKKITVSAFETTQPTPETSEETKASTRTKEDIADVINDKTKGSFSNSVSQSDVQISGSTTVIRQVKTSQSSGPSVITEKRIIQSSSEIPQEILDLIETKSGSEFSIPELNKELSESTVKTVITKKTTSQWSEPDSEAEGQESFQGPDESSRTNVPEISDVAADSDESKCEGMVNLHIHRARNLVKMDIIGKSDPFIVVTVNDVIYRSETINNDLNPEFDYKCQFEVDNATEKIKIELFDEDYIKDSDFMGEILLDVKSLKSVPICESWMPLDKCAHGEVQLSAQYEALPVQLTSDVKIVEDVTASTLSRAKEGDVREEDADSGMTTTLSRTISEWTGETSVPEGSDLSFHELMSGVSGSRIVTTKTTKWSEPTVHEGTIQELSESDFPELTRESNSKTIITKVRTTSLQSEPTVITERRVIDGSQISIPEVSDFSSFSDLSNTKTTITKVRTTSLQSQPTIITERRVISDSSQLSGTDEPNTTVMETKVKTTSFQSEPTVITERRILDGSQFSIPEISDISSISDLSTSKTTITKVRTTSMQSQPTIITERRVITDGSELPGDDDAETTVTETKVISVKSGPSVITKTVVHEGAGQADTEASQSVELNGCVSLHVHKGRNLVKMDIIGKSDPYIVVTVNGETFRSETINNDLNPDFDFKCDFDVGSATEAKIEIWDEDYIKDSDFMGEIVLDLKSLKEKSILENWIPLEKCDHGEILLSAQFTEYLNEPFTDEVKIQSHHSALSSLDPEKEDFAMQLDNMGIEEIRFKGDMSEESEEKILLEHVSKLQKSTSSKIDNLMKTVQQADASFTSQGDLSGFSSFQELDNCGNVVTTYSKRSTVTKTILDGEGNVIEQVTTSYKDPSSSESDTSPTLEDVIYKEYPHLSKPFEQETMMGQMSSFQTIQRYYHCSNQPFENITSLRAHFVQPLYSDDEEMKAKTERKGISVSNDRGNNNDVDSNPGNNRGSKSSRKTSEKDDFKSSPVHFPSNLAFQIGKFDDDIESGLELLSSNTTFSPRIRDNTLESGLPESVDFGTDKTLDCQSLEYVQELELDGPNSEVKDTVDTWIQPVISGTCLQSKLFWKTESPVVSQDSSPVFSQESLPPTIVQSKSTDHSPRSPTSIVKSISPSGSVHSLPASPIKRISTSVRKLTSESFSSEHDISKSLEIVYVEPDVDPKEELTAHYKTASPSLEKKFEKRKPSYTQLKRPVSYDLRSDSPNGTNSESDLLSSNSSDILEAQKLTSSDFTPYITDMLPLLSKKTPSPTKISTTSHSYSVHRQVSEEILSPLFDILSKAPVRSPEKKFEYVQGLKETLLEDNLIHVTQPQPGSLHEELSDRIMGGKQSQDSRTQTVTKEVSFVDPSGRSFKSLSRETSNLSGLNREPSFIYDTTVEAFSSEGASVDDIDTIELCEEEEEGEDQGISIIGRMVLALDDEQNKTTETDEKKTKVSVADISFSSSPRRMDTVFLTESGDELRDEEKGVGVAIPERERRFSNLSTENISTTPEAEKYFMKREASFMEKVAKGELESLAVEISDFCKKGTDLKVKPVNTSPSSEIEVVNLKADTDLTVKPLEKRTSSYETVYEKIILSEGIGSQQPAVAELLGNLGDNYKVVTTIPDQTSSFEDLYQRTAGVMAGEVVSSALDTFEPDRWSAPAGSVEPPILEADEFSIRFDPVAEQIQGHWQELEILMEDAKPGEASTK